MIFTRNKNAYVRPATCPQNHYTYVRFVGKV